MTDTKSFSLWDISKIIGVGALTIGINHILTINKAKKNKTLHGDKKDIIEF
jgi:hypothetical protein